MFENRLIKKVRFMAIYSYSDDFIVNSINSETLDNEELKALEEVEKLNVSDDYYKEKLVVTKVYISLSLLQLENDGMQLKYNGYSKEFTRYLTLSKNKSSSSNISSIPIMRG